LGQRQGFAVSQNSAIDAEGWAGRLTQKQLKHIKGHYNPNTRCFELRSETTIRRVLQSADVEALDTQLGAWFLKVAGLETIAIDGRTLKGAVCENGTQVPLTALPRSALIEFADPLLPARTGKIIPHQVGIPGVCFLSMQLPPAR